MAGVDLRARDAGIRAAFYTSLNGLPEDEAFLLFYAVLAGVRDTVGTPTMLALVAEVRKRLNAEAEGAEVDPVPALDTLIDVCGDLNETVAMNAIGAVLADWRK